MEAGLALGSAGPNTVKPAVCCCVYNILEQSKVENSNTGPLKAWDPIGNNWSNWLTFSPTWNSQLLLPRLSWQQSYGSKIYIYLTVQFPSPSDHGMNSIQPFLIEICDRLIFFSLYSCFVLPSIKLTDPIY